MTTQHTFKVGSTYRYASRAVPLSGATFANQDKSFTVGHVDSDGDAWTHDILWDGRAPTGWGWCIATQEQLRLGQIVEVV